MEISLVPRLSPRTTTMNSKEGESLVIIAHMISADAQIYIPTDAETAK